MKIRIYYLAFVIGLGSVLCAQAANDKVGTSGAQFLKIGAGARPTAMGEAFVGIADDVNAVYYNPAGLASVSQPEITAMHMEWFQGMNYDFGAFAYPTDMGAFAFSAATLRTDNLEKRGTDESLQGSFDAMDAAYTLSYSRTFGPLTSLGLTGRYIEQKIDIYSARTWSGDVGLLQRLGSRPIKVGVAVKHLGESVKFRSESDPLPLTLDVGVGANLFRERMKLGFDVKKARDNDSQVGTGLEWMQPAGENLRFALRGGYNSATTDPDATGMSLGAGVGYKQFDIDFAWVPFGDLGNTFRYAFHARF
ncbi:MAG: PorV/PorQ family protein [Elusimicrobia bacterium]|nr:PorV/PorQ family protein [Candidatus Obscuribacterium magneticum]MCB4755493.1 PorV/PorQ family protein [Candidatus Obscuribacterium magneticum]